MRRKDASMPACWCLLKDISTHALQETAEAREDEVHTERRFKD
jgi:hypothetical protein